MGVDQAQFQFYVAYKMEVKVGGFLAWRANNPGNLRAAPTKIGSVPGKSGHFAVFATMDDGPSENNTKKYLAQLKAAGVDPDKDVKSQIDSLMKGVQANEVMMKGVVIPRTK